MRKSEQVACPQWNPYSSYVWTAKQIQAWFDYCGAWGLFDGEIWQPVSKRIGPGRYEVTFKKKVYE